MPLVLWQSCFNDINDVQPVKLLAVAILWHQQLKNRIITTPVNSQKRQVRSYPKEADRTAYTTHNVILASD